MLSKECVCCHRRKEVSQFGKNKRTEDGYHYYCKSCRTVHNKRDWSKYKRQHKNARLKRVYGISISEFDRMFKFQRGVCVLCGVEGGLKGLQVDHCHITGKVRGLLCVSCNTFLGRLEANPHLLSNIERYLGS